MEISNTFKAHTIAFYEANAIDYFESTKDMSLGNAYKRFLTYIPKKARLLDAGSGSGRDTRHFLQLGHEVDAFDASPALAALSTTFTGRQTLVMEFAELNATGQYDGIWACASLLHLPHSELAEVFRRLGRAVKFGGIIYASFRHGTTEVVSGDGRFFTDLNYERALSMLKPVAELHLIESWIDIGPGANGKDFEWFNMICKKTEIETTA